MKLSKVLLLSMLTLCMIFSSCDKDEPKAPSSSEVNPEISSISATTTLMDFTITFRVKSVNSPNVSMVYSSETGKTSNPSLNRTSTPHVIKIVDVKSSGYS